MRLSLLNLVALLGLVAGGCARDNPMFELEPGATGTSGPGDGDKGGSSDNNPDSSPPGDDNGGTIGADTIGADTHGDTMGVDTGPGDASAGDTFAGDTFGNDASSSDDGNKVEPPCERPTDEQELLSIADTFVAYDTGPYCGNQQCEGQNFGARPVMGVVGEDLDGQEVHLLARFQVDELDLSTVLSAQLELTIGGDKDGFPDVTLVASDVLDQSWGEGAGGAQGAGDGASDAEVGESSWWCSSCPTGWNGEEANFPETIGDELGSAFERIIAPGEVFYIPIEHDMIVPGPDGTYSVTVTSTDSSGSIPLMTREANNASIVLRYSGCQ